MRLVAVLALLGACGTQSLVMLRFRGGPDDALVTVNDRYIGKLGELERRGLRLPPGRYRVTVEKVGYFPFDLLVDAGDPAGEIAVELTPVPD